MKKIIFVLFTLLLTSVAFAQTGGWYIGGNLGLTGNRNDYGSYTQRYTNWSISPEIGFFAREDIQLGISIGLNGTSYRHVYGRDDLQRSSVNFAPLVYARKHFTIVENFNVFIGANFGFNTGTTRYYNDITYSTNGFSAYLNAGIWYQINPKFAVAAQYGFLGYREYNDGNGKRRTFGLDVNTLGPVFNLGIYYTINKQ